MHPEDPHPAGKSRRFPKARRKMPTRRFDLPAASLLPGSAAALELGSDASADVAQAVLANDAFPEREVQLGAISLEAEAGREVALGHSGGQVKFGGSFRGNAGLAVLNSPEAVLKSLDLGDDNPFPLVEALRPASGGFRYVLFLAGYEAAGSIEGAHPIGGFGTLSFGAAGERERRFAVIKRILADTGARDAIRDTVGSIRLPRQIDEAGDLSPGVMLVAEVNGSVAFHVAASLGYDFSFVRDLASAGVTGDIGLKLDLGLKAALGFNASGRYLVAVDRASLETGSQTLRLRLFKLSQRGWQFGLNLAASVSTQANLPADADDFVKAVFGVHGEQIVEELKRIEEWTDSSKDLSDLVAGLGAEQGLDLLRRVTGIDPETAFEDARRRLLDAIKLWDSLPDRASGALWNLLGEVAGSEALRGRVLSALTVIGGGDAPARRKALVELIGAPGFESTPLGRLLLAAAPRGVTALLDDTELPEIARLAHRILDGNALSETLQRLQAYINEALNLDALRKVARKTDFEALNGWLVGRISALLDEKLQFEKLDEIRETINKVVVLRQVIYEKAVRALNRRYDFTLAATWQKATAHSALLDAEFDMGDDAARGLFVSVLGKANYDSLLTNVVPGVTLHKAVLTHEIERRSSIEVNMPYYASKTMKLNKALAKVEAEDDGERVLVYTLDAKDEITRVNRFRSQLGVSAALSLPVSGVRRHGQPRTSWSYSYRMARRNMRMGEVLSALHPIVDQYFPRHFPEGPDSSLAKWVGDLDREIENAVGNGPDEFGDVLLSAEVTLPGGALAAWVAERPKADAIAAAKRVSVRLQHCLKQLIPFYYFQDLDQLHQNQPSSALLLWASLPPLNDIRIVGGKVEDRLNSDKVFWDWLDPAKRTAVVDTDVTKRNLLAQLIDARDRLRAAGRSSQAGFFEPNQLGSHIAASEFLTAPQFHSLLFTEATTVRGCERALLDISEFWKDSATLPSRAIARLAEFGAEITKTFNSNLSSVYGKQFLRPLGSMLFLEAARALDPALGASNPNALLALTVLKETADFPLQNYLDNIPPPAEAVALEQRLVAAD